MKLLGTLLNLARLRQSVEAPHQLIYWYLGLEIFQKISNYSLKRFLFEEFEMSIQLQLYVSHLVSTMKSFRGLKTVFILPPHTYGNKHQRGADKRFRAMKRSEMKGKGFFLILALLEQEPTAKIYLLEYTSQDQYIY